MVWLHETRNNRNTTNLKFPNVNCQFMKIHICIIKLIHSTLCSVFGEIIAVGHSTLVRDFVRWTMHNKRWKIQILMKTTNNIDNSQRKLLIFQIQFRRVNHDINNAKQKHLRCKKLWGQSEAAIKWLYTCNQNVWYLAKAKNYTEYR